FHFEPLKFAEDGTAVVACQARAVAEVPARLGHNNPIPGLDQTSGDQLFHTFCDVGAFQGQVRRIQTFTASRSGRLSVLLTTFQRAQPDADLYLDLVRIGNDELPYETLTSVVLERNRTSWSSRVQRIDFGWPAVQGARYGIQLRAPLTAGCYGFAYSDAN